MLHCYKSPPSSVSKQRQGYWQRNEKDENEMIYVLPEQPTPRRRCSTPPHKRSGPDGLVRLNSVPSSVPELSLWDRLVRCRNIWCLPKVDREEAEELLRGTEEGNFILRVASQGITMILSRSAQPESNTSTDCIQHHTIDVVPRSGYCLTGDRNAHLVFQSIIQMMHFYIRLPRNRSQEGPFLRLPRSVMDATTATDLDMINKMGKAFWHTGRSTNPNDRRSRNLSEERRPGIEGKHTGRPLGRNDPVEIRNGPPVSPKRPIWRIRDRASSVSSDRSERKEMVGLDPRRPTLGRANTVDQQPDLDEVNRKLRSAIPGLYEGDDSNLWDSMVPSNAASKPILSPARIKLGTEVDRSPFWINKRNRPNQLLILSRSCEQRAELHHQPSPQKSAPPNIISTPTDGGKLPRFPLVNATIGTPLDEHLRSFTTDDCEQNAACLLPRKPWLPQQQAVDANDEDFVPSSSTIEDSGHGTMSAQSDPSKPGSNYRGPLIELPTPKTVGRVFVMEAASQPNDHYSLLSDSHTERTPKPNPATPSSGIYRATHEQYVVPKTQPHSQQLQRHLSPLGRSNTSSIEVELFQTRHVMSMRSMGQAASEGMPRQTSVPRAYNLVNQEKSIDQRSAPPLTTGATNQVYDFESSSSDVSLEVPNRIPGGPNGQHDIGRTGLERYNKSPTKEKPTDVHYNDLSRRPSIVKLSRKPTLERKLYNATRHQARRDSVPSEGFAQSGTTESIRFSPTPSSRCSTVFCTPWEEAPSGVYLSNLADLRPDPEVIAPLRQTSYPTERESEDERLAFDRHGPHSKSVAKTTDVFGSGHSTPDHKHLPASITTDSLPPTPVIKRSSDTPSVRYESPPKVMSPSLESQMPGFDLIRSRSVTPYAVSNCSRMTPDSRSHHDIEPGPARNAPAEHPMTFQAIPQYANRDPSLGSDRPLVQNPLPSRSDEILNRTTKQNTITRRWVNQGEDYVYAQVVPHHLRQGTYGSMPTSVNPESSDTLPPSQHAYPVKPNIAMDILNRGSRPSRQNRTLTVPVNISSAEYNFRSGPQPPQSYGRLARPPTAGSEQGEDVRSESNFSLVSSQASCPYIGHPAPNYYPSNSRIEYTDDSMKPIAESGTQESRRTGHYIRKFMKQLMKDKHKGVGQKVYLFLECIKMKPDQDPYRIMQGIRQFISGLTRHLFETHDPGLAEAAEQEQQELSDLGFLNVSSVVETTIQRYILRPLYRQIIQLLKLEQLKANELGPLRTVVQLACFHSNHNSIMDNTKCLTEFKFPDWMPLPPESTVQTVQTLFHELEATYSVSEKTERLTEIFKCIRKEVLGPGSNNYAVDCAEQWNDLHAVYAWTLARAGVLLAPIISLSKTSQETHNPTMAFYSPVALQADYLDSLATDTQLVCNDRCSLADLLRTLRWAWSQHSEQSLPNTPGSSFDMYTNLGDHAHSEIGLRQTKPTVAKSIDPQMNANGGIKLSEATGSEHQRKPESVAPKGRRRLLLPLLRRKSLAPNAKSGETDTDANGTILKSARKLSLSVDTGATVPEKQSSTKPVWRPWAGVSDECAGKSVVRVVVMDERTNRIKVQPCSARPDMTVRELVIVLASKMGVFDPQNFRLFLWLDRREYQLPDNCKLLEIIESTSIPTLDPSTQDRYFFPESPTLFGYPPKPTERSKEAPELTSHRRRSRWHNFHLFNRRKRCQLTTDPPRLHKDSASLSWTEISTPIVYNGPPILVYRRIGSLFAISNSALSRALTGESVPPTNSL